MSDKNSEAPKGFDVQVGRALGDGWVKKGEGVVVQGRLIGRFIGTQQDDDGVYQAFYQVKLDVTCAATKKDKDSGKVEDVTLQPGQILNIGEHKALEDLSPRTRDGGVYDVWFKYIRQDKVPNTRRTFWVVDGPRLKVIKPAQHAPTPEVVKRGEANTSPSDVDAPF